MAKGNEWVWRGLRDDPGLVSGTPRSSPVGAFKAQTHVRSTYFLREDSVGLVYILTNPSMPGLVKIGMTEQDDANVRVAQLYTTGVPFPFTIEFVGKVADAERVEDAFHIAFGPYRVNPKREFFRIDPEQAIALLSLLHSEDATEEVKSQITGIDEQSLAAAQNEVSRRPKFSFEEMGVPVGAELAFVKGGVTVCVADSKKVRYGDELVTLSALTKKLLDLPYYVRPAIYWTYNGRLLSEIYDDTYEAQ